MFLVEQALGLQGAAPERLAAPPTEGGVANLTIFMDYVSPWSYFASQRLGALLRDVSPVAVRVEWVPMLLVGGEPAAHTHYILGQTLTKSNFQVLDKNHGQ